MAPASGDQPAWGSASLVPERDHLTARNAERPLRHQRRGRSGWRPGCTACRCRGRHGGATGPGRHTERHDRVLLRPAGRLRPGREARHRGRRPRGAAGPRRRAARRGRGRRPAAPRALRQDGQGQLPGQPQVRTLPGELQLLLAGARLDRGHPQVQVAQHRRGAGAGGRRPPGRRHPGLHGLQRPRPHQQGRRAGRRDGRHHQVRAPRGRDLRLPGAAQGRPGRAAARGRRRRLQPQHQHRRVPPRPDRADPHVRRPRRHRREGQDRRALAVQRADRRARRDRRAAGGGAVRAQGARLRLDPGQLPDAVRRHAAREHLGAHADALREDPRDGAVRLPGPGDPDRRWPRDAPAHPAGARPERRELALPRRLPHLGGAVRRRGPRADPRPRLHGARVTRPRGPDAPAEATHDPAKRRRGAGTAVAPNA